MKALLSLILLPGAICAQPGDDLFSIPCGMASYGRPLQDTRRDDVHVVTTSQGTDNEPSSSGHCLRQVMPMEHAEFLLEKDRQGYWVIHEAKAGEVLDPDTLKAALAADRLRWGKYNLPICYQYYGAAHDGKGWHPMEPRTWERSIVRLTTSDAVYLVAMTVSIVGPDGRIEVHGQRVVVEGTPLIIP